MKTDTKKQGRDNPNHMQGETMSSKEKFAFDNAFQELEVEGFFDNFEAKVRDLLLADKVNIIKHANERMKKSKFDSDKNSRQFFKDEVTSALKQIKEKTK